MPACTFGFKCESVDMTVRLQPRFEIGPEITAPLHAFLQRLFQLSIYPVDIYLWPVLLGMASVLSLFMSLQKVRLYNDMTDDTV